MNDSSIIESIPVQFQSDIEESKVIEEARIDVKAFSRLYRVYVQQIYRYIFSRTGQIADTEDLTSQVFMQAMESLPRYRHQGHFRAWLFSIARHLVINYRTRSPHEASLDMVDLQIQNIQDPLIRINQTEQLVILAKLTAQLKEEDRELLRLRYVAELSFAEIAIIFHRNEAAVKKQIYRTLSRLKNQMEGCDETD
jgi:RNA polymerase sigma-70 factor, ECF subfamily